MAKKIYNKLVRDKIPEIINRSGKQLSTSVLDDQQYGDELKNKMVEEAQELVSAKTREDILNELADLEELIQTVSKHNNISAEELEQKRLSKKDERGGFDQRIFLHEADE